MKFQQGIIRKRVLIDKIDSSISNMVQVQSYKRIQEVITRDNAFQLLRSLRELSLNSTELLIFFSNAMELSTFHTLIKLKQQRGSDFYTHREELIKLSHSDTYSIDFVLYLLESLKVISISESSIFRIEFSNDKELCKSRKMLKVRQGCNL
ncbi:hypothetical protein A9Q84_07085 [Halobacteriovorax marinus]|uniref:Uncharacterized protein n=1 Tax=Halobacteriovorax marinus TaxID=97084 RepID=A0A1Y5FB82_9BACT|nr:hypothetical protein A9Q84_07085 [Halobacteriovorax marinus]